MRDLEHGERGDAGGQAREAHQRQAEDERQEAADQGGEHERGDVAERVVAQDREEIGQHARLRLDGDRHHAGGEPADCDEADLAEREHARVADEHVHGHHHRDRDEGVEEVQLVGLRDLGRDEPDQDDQQARPEQLDGRDAGAWRAHTRSTTEVRPRTNRPAGRSRSTRMTSAKTTEGR